MEQKSGNRRAPGEIRDAIVRVLETRPKGAKVAEIRQAVEQELGGPVAPSSVRSYLNLGTNAATPIFKRIGHGQYRLARRG